MILQWGGKPLEFKPTPTASRKSAKVGTLRLYLAIYSAHDVCVTSRHRDPTVPVLGGQGETPQEALDQLHARLTVLRTLLTQALNNI